MEYAQLGNTGLSVSRICLGMMSYGDPSWRPWVLNEEQGLPFVKRALELGINFFDTADMYSLGASEQVLGSALRHYARRDEVVVASKVYFPMGKKPNQGGLSSKHILESIDNTLKRIGTDYLDLYQIHRWDYNTPIEETMQALHDVVRSGKVRYLGASSMFATQLAKANHVSELRGLTKFVTMQNHYNLLYREEEREMNRYCASEGIGLLPWSPLARGFLSGGRTRDQAGGKQTGTARAASDTYADSYYNKSEDFDVIDCVRAVAEKRGISMSQVSLAWLLSRPGVVAPIIGATKMSHLEEAAASVKIRLTPDEITLLESKYKPHAVLGHL